MIPISREELASEEAAKSVPPTDPDAPADTAVEDAEVAEEAEDLAHRQAQMDQGIGPA